MHEVTLLINIAVALVVAFFGGLIARRLGLPTIAGYLLAGIAIGPFTPGFVGDTETISQLAELGVIFLMFGVGLHFSLKDLWRVRSEHYDLPINTDEEHRLLRDLLEAESGIEIRWFRLADASPLLGQTLADANLRARTGASVVAVLRQGELQANPKSGTVFQSGDRIGFIGDDQEIAAVEQLLSMSTEGGNEDNASP